jgi:hypothetical protein
MYNNPSIHLSNYKTKQQSIYSSLSFIYSSPLFSYLSFSLPFLYSLSLFVLSLSLSLSLSETHTHIGMPALSACACKVFHQGILSISIPWFHGSTLSHTHWHAHTFCLRVQSVPPGRAVCPSLPGSVFPGLSMAPHLRFVLTRDVDLAILLSNAISIENFPSFQITTAGNSDNV